MNIKLISIHMENFKCHKSLTVDFGGEDTSIYGDNATGKTSIYDAFCWLLFGKDSAGNGEKNIDIKPLDENGEVADHEAVTEVEAVLLADGEERSLKRTYREIWSTKRGSSEASYDGNTSDYYVDGVPCKQNAYKAAVAELVDEDTFRLLTTVNYFPEVMPWAKRRETLFSLFGAESDREIMARSQQFRPLLEAMGKLELADFKKILAQRKKGYTLDRNELPARISECEKTIADLEGLDFEGAAEQLEALSGRKEAIASELLAIRQNTAVQSKRLEVRESQMALDSLEAENRRYRMEQETQKPNVAALERELRQNEGYLSSAKRQLERLGLEKSRCEKAIEASREQWKKKHAERYDGSEMCPTCGQRLPESAVNAAVSAWADRQKAALDGLVADSQRYKENLAQYQQEEKELVADIQGYEKQIAALEDRIAAAQSQAAAVKDIDGYQERRAAAKAKITQKEAELAALEKQADSTTAGLRTRQREIDWEIEKQTAILGKKSALEYAQGRIEELRKNAKDAAAALSEVEKLLYLADEFSRFKAGALEDGINHHFKLANFRLFREQANGGVEERCDVTYDGVPYTGLNNGMKINVGIDIIDTLSAAYGVKVPLFIDNAESVTKLGKTGCQVIRLVVSENDKELKINHG
nr:MAG TPA: chromosome partition protein [Caudoviricetes sp.]